MIIIIPPPLLSTSYISANALVDDILKSCRLIFFCGVHSDGNREENEGLFCHTDQIILGKNMVIFYCYLKICLTKFTSSTYLLYNAIYIYFVQYSSSYNHSCISLNLTCTIRCVASMTYFVIYINQSIIYESYTFELAFVAMSQIKVRIFIY